MVSHQTPPSSFGGIFKAQRSPLLLRLFYFLRYKSPEISFFCLKVMTIFMMAGQIEIVCKDLLVYLRLVLYYSASFPRDKSLRCELEEMIGTKTYSAKSETVARDWFVVDATGKALGRLASEIATRLRGKHKAIYTPHVDTGDYIVVINAEKVRVTGNKMTDKNYYRHTGYPGGIKEISFDKLIEKAPERVIETAVKGMLPKNPLGRSMFRKLKVYAGSEHNHSAQQPKVLEI